MRKIYPLLIPAFIIAFSVSAQVESPDTLISLSTVEITDYQGDNTSPAKVDFLPATFIDQLPLKDVGTALRNIPNVNGVRKGGAVSDPVIRGFKYGQINVHANDGQKIEGGCPNRMDPAVAHFDIDDIAALEVIKGPYALRYGPNFGGMINIRTKQPAPGKEFSVHVGAMMGYESNGNGLKNRLNIDVGNGKVFFSLSGNLKRYGNYVDGSREEVRSGFERYNYSAQLGIVPFKNSTMLISFDQSLGRNVLFPALPMDEREDDTRLFSLDYKAERISEHFRAFKAKFYVSDVKHLMDNKQRPFSDTVVAVSDIDARNYGFHVDGQFLYGENELVIGTDYEHILKDGTRTKTRILEPGMPVMSENLWNEAQIQNNGLFFLYHRRISNLHLETALRLDFNRANSGEMKLEKMGNIVYRETDVTSSYTNLSASVGGRYFFSDGFSLALSLGRGVRSPDMSERFIILLPVGYDNYDYLGNPSLNPEVNYEADISLRLELPGTGNFEGGFFFAYVTDYITAQVVPETVARPQTKGVFGVKRFYNADQVHMRGFEISYSSPETWKWGVKASAACTRGINPEATAYIIENGEVTGSEIVKNDPLPEIPPLEGAIDLYYRFHKGRFVPNVNVRIVAQQNQISMAYMEERTPGFALLNFNFSYRLNDYLKIVGGVSNILDKAYYEHLNRRIIGNSGKLYEPGRSFYASLYFYI